MNILIACEESQRVTKTFREKGHKAYSCDIIDCSGKNPEWHIKDNVLNILKDDWDMMVAFPPCTHLTVSGARWFPEKKKDGRQQRGINFFMEIVNAPINKIAIENPIGIMSNIYRPPDQIIHPYYFGDPHSKGTCLWLKNLPLLKHYKENDLFYRKTWVEPEYIISKTNKKYSMIHYIGGRNSKIRSKTFPGVALAMAEQWG